MAEPIWLDLPGVHRAHDEVVALTGGAPGIRDEGLLNSARNRPVNLFAYDGVEDIVVLAATYAVAIAKNHPFVDGNKRAAFIAMATFMGRNGIDLTASQADATAIMLRVAAGEIDIDALAAWIRDNSAAR